MSQNILFGNSPAQSFFICSITLDLLNSQTLGNFLFRYIRVIDFSFALHESSKLCHMSVKLLFSPLTRPNFCISRDCNNTVMEMLIMAYACKTSTARRVVGVIPYLPYSQQCKMCAMVFVFPLIFFLFSV